MQHFEKSVAASLLAAIDLSSEEEFKILLALSGGPDSVSLLLALKAGLTQGQIHVCHVNHGLRGEESLADEQFCRELCRELNVSLSVKNLDIFSAEDAQVSEERLRQLRYQALLEVAEGQAIPYVVTGHTMDDQIETMLFRLCRGTSIHGLSGMKPVRALSNQVALVRPMLGFERSSVEEYLLQGNAAARLDRSNLDNRYTRNFLRHDVIPLLRERFTNLVINFERCRTLCDQEDMFMAEVARAELSKHREGRMSVGDFALLHPALRARVITEMMTRKKIELSFERVERVLAALNSNDDTRVSIGDGFDFSIKNSFLDFVTSAELDAGEEDVERVRSFLNEIALPLPEPGKCRTVVVPWLNKALRLESLQSQVPSGEVVPFPHRQALHALVDLSNIEGTLKFRPRLDGDTIQPLGMNQPVRLKQYLHANKDINVPAQQLLPGLNEAIRQRLIPLLSDDKEVLWVPGYGLSEKIRVGATPTHGIALIELFKEGLEQSDFC